MPVMFVARRCAVRQIRTSRSYTATPQRLAPRVIAPSGVPYRPGAVIKLRRQWGPKLDAELKGKEAERAWQLSLGLTLGIIFVALPWSCDAACVLMSLISFPSFERTTVVRAQTLLSSRIYPVTR